MRAQTLAEVAAIAAVSPEGFDATLSEFLDEFYLDGEAQDRSWRLDQRQQPTSSEEINAWLGAAGTGSCPATLTVA